MKFKKRSSNSQFLLFLLVGGINAFIDIGSLNVLLKIWPTTDKRILILFNTLAYLLAVTNSYVWNTRFAFRHYAQKDVREKIYFFIQAGISLIVSNLTFLGALHILGLYSWPLWLIQNIAKVLAMAVPSTVSFLLMKYFVFRKLKKGL